MTVARSRGGPGLGCAALPGGEPLTSWHLASGAGCAMGTAVGPEAPLPNRTPLMAVASTSENRSETVNALPDKEGASQSSSSTASASALVPTQMLTPVASHTHELDQPGHCRSSQVAADVSGLISQACQLSLPSSPA
jgi:hypothetical protein